MISVHNESKDYTWQKQELQVALPPMEIALRYHLGVDYPLVFCSGSLLVCWWAISQLAYTYFPDNMIYGIHEIYGKYMANTWICSPL